MKLSTNWLKEYIDIDCPLETLAERLTMAGMEVEEISKFPKEKFTAMGGAGISDDVIYDVKITPNRGDWLSIIGVAREAAPLVESKVRMPEPKVEGTGAEACDKIKISIENQQLCGRYVGVVVRNVHIHESPDWMKNRLIAAGMRPINNVVDITNYVMLELGQPLHAFDYNLLHGKQIVVRTARPGETITSIDGVERKLEPDMLVIADADRPVAIAGVMGGSDSEVSRQTQDILIEAANFNTVSIRRTSKRLGLVTESSYRFERGVDPSVTALAALRAAELMQELAGGQVCKGAVDVYPSPVKPLELTARPERVNAVLGTQISSEVMVEYLNKLDIEAVIESGVLKCRIPTYRQDITREIDLVEEVGRAFGYENLETTLPKIPTQGKDSREGRFRDKLRRILMSCGGQEVLTHSLVDGKLAELAGRSEMSLKVRNPLSEELDAMRVMLIPNLLQVIARNQAYGTNDVSVFEMGKVYFIKNGEIGEKLSIAGAMIGSMWKSAWSLPAEALDVDFFLCKGAVESLLEELGINSVTFEEIQDVLLHPTRAAKVLVNGREVGMLGEASPSVRESLDVRERPCVFELDFEALMELTPEVLHYSQLPRYPAIYRHMSVVVPDEVKYADLVELVCASGEGMVEDVGLLDVYRSEQIGVDKRSLTLSLVFRSREKTLTDTEVDAVLAEIKDALSKKAGATFR